MIGAGQFFEFGIFRSGIEDDGCASAPRAVNRVDQRALGVRLQVLHLVTVEEVD